MKRSIHCNSCGKRAEYTACSEREDLPDDACCNVLRDWLMVSRWKGVGHIDERHFCSSDCLLKWAEAQVPRIPKTFLDAFQEGGTQ